MPTLILSKHTTTRALCMLSLRSFFMDLSLWTFLNGFILCFVVSRLHFCEVVIAASNVKQRQTMDPSGRWNAYIFFSTRLFDDRKTGGPGPRATCALRAKEAWVGGTASCSTSSSGGSWAPGSAPATYGAPSSVAATVLCKATLEKPHQRRSQPCLADQAKRLRTPAPANFACEDA